MRYDAVGAGRFRRRLYFGVERLHFAALVRVTPSCMQFVSLASGGIVHRLIFTCQLRTPFLMCCVTRFYEWQWGGLQSPGLSSAELGTPPISTAENTAVSYVRNRTMCLTVLIPTSRPRYERCGGRSSLSPIFEECGCVCILRDYRDDALSFYYFLVDKFGPERVFLR